MFRWIWTPANDILRGFVRYLPNLFYILVIVVFTRFMIQILEFSFEQAHRGVINLEPWIHRDVARPTSQIAKAILIVLALFFIAPLLPGIGNTTAEAIAVMIGLMVSLGSTSTVGNVIAGVVLTYMRPYKIGDRIQLGDTVGDVLERTFMYTKVLTIKNEEVIVPSLQALGGAMINYSARAKQEGLILHTSVTIGYDVPWRKVHELLIQAAGRTAGVLQEPRPYVLQTSLDDWYVSYQINAYTDEPNRMATIYAELHQNIQDCFNEGGVESMSPHYYQLRDGNAVTIPPDYLKNYEPPRFLVDTRVSEKKALSVSRSA
ncbi:MAG: mechanosensitive ion channel [Acidobacteria bacterium]|nr:mechanosensitive ion channel [Acidobacteriota bacterium]